ncbi:MAG: hypothetical protein SGI71_09300 [Verrucomicrobiota bacterium]|nr:hypothetical protein [Verrucomicrobiota bacterium]
MRLFTFSGISATLAGLNKGTALIHFANKVLERWPSNHRPIYDPDISAVHFKSYVNFSKIISDLDGLVTFDGSDVLNREAEKVSGGYAQDIADIIAEEDEQMILVLAHSQGCNNFVHTFSKLYEEYPGLMEGRVVRAALFDPKVGSMQVQNMIAHDKEQLMELFFFQSECDLLDNQSILRQKFIDVFPHGNHLWIKDLNHSTICQWDRFALKKKMAVLDEYLLFKRSYRKRMIELQRERTKSGLGPKEIAALASFVNRYPFMNDKPQEALLGFLAGKLPVRFKS